MKNKRDIKRKWLGLLSSGAKKRASRADVLKETRF
jgi:hypothetical protein